MFFRILFILLNIGYILYRCSLYPAANPIALIEQAMAPRTIAFTTNILFMSLSLPLYIVLRYIFIFISFLLYVYI